MDFLRNLSKNVYTVSFVVLTLTLLLGVCGCESSWDSTVSKTDGESVKPTKEAIVSILHDLNTSLDAKNYKKALAFMQPFPNLTPEKMMTALAKFQKKKEISAAGIAILSEKGKFGPLLEIFPKRGIRFAKRAGVDAGACYALAHKGAEVAAHWDGKTFHLIRLDDVGKLR